LLCPLLLPLAASRAEGPETRRGALRRVGDGTPQRTPCREVSQRSRSRTSGSSGRRPGPCTSPAAQDAVDYKGTRSNFSSPTAVLLLSPAGSSQVIRRSVDEKGLEERSRSCYCSARRDNDPLPRGRRDPRKGGEETVLRLSPWRRGSRGTSDRPRRRHGDALIREIHVFDGWRENHLYLTDVMVNPSFPPTFSGSGSRRVSWWTGDATARRAPTVRIHNLGWERMQWMPRSWRASFRKGGSSSCRAVRRRGSEHLRIRAGRQGRVDRGDPLPGAGNGEDDPAPHRRRLHGAGYRTNSRNFSRSRPLPRPWRHTGPPGPSRRDIVGGRTVAGRSSAMRLLSAAGRFPTKRTAIASRGRHRSGVPENP